MLTATLKNIIDGSLCKKRTTVMIDNEEDYLIVEFCCEHSGTYDTPYARYNDPIYRGEVVEFFVGRKNAELYYEFDLAPNNVLFNAKIFYHEKHGAFVKVIDERFVIHSVQNMKGSYIAKMKIPLVEIGGSGQEFIFNAYRIVSNGEEKEFQALNPIGKIDFHHREKFVELKMKGKI